MGSLTQWYEEDANTLRPVAFEALRHEAATRWMQFVQFGKVRQASDLLQREGSGTGAADGPSFSGPTTAQDEPNGDETPIARALEAADCNPSAIPIGSVHPLFAPGLIQLEDSRSGFVNDDFLRREQRHELARDEQLFWERVELIRKGQVATIGNKPKRCYADEAEVEKSNIDEKIQLRFTK
ncbi:hypothetical protein ERJ75_001341300 [Trypanosoma vivax]|nr:hypothetical protein ERJ75_001341300 [Trypanosoma vivax]